jgi:hypothetical protein
MALPVASIEPLPPSSRQDWISVAQSLACAKFADKSFKSATIRLVNPLFTIGTTKSQRLMYF